MGVNELEERGVRESRLKNPIKGEGKRESHYGVTVIIYCSSFGLETGAGKGSQELQESSGKEF